MATIIYRGSTPTIYISPTNGMHVDDLGEPSVAISQDVEYISPEVTVDSTNNRLVIQLTEEDTLMLTEGVETQIQAIYKASNGDIYRFPVHNLTVAPTLIEYFDEEDEVFVEEDEEIVEEESE